jgi:hypothetical protein
LARTPPARPWKKSDLPPSKWEWFESYKEFLDPGPAIGKKMAALGVEQEIWDSICHAGDSELLLPDIEFDNVLDIGPKDLRAVRF